MLAQGPISSPNEHGIMSLEGFHRGVMKKSHCVFKDPRSLKMELSFPQWNWFYP